MMASVRAGRPFDVRLFSLSSLRVGFIFTLRRVKQNGQENEDEDVDDRF